MDILDSHAHFLPPKLRENASFYPPIWSEIEKLLSFMADNAIKKSALLYPTSDANKRLGEIPEARLFNEELCNLDKDYKDRFILSFILPQCNKERLIQEAKYAVCDLGLKILSIPSSYKGRYLDDSFYWGLYEFLNDKNIPIFVHSQTEEPIGVERFFDPLLTPVMQYLFDLSISLGKLIMAGIPNRFPNLKFVFAHFAGVVPFLAKRFDTTYAMLRGINVVKDLGDEPSNILRKFYVDTSGVASINALNLAIEVFGKDNILFGSDWPANKDALASINLIKNLSAKGETSPLRGGDVSEDILKNNLERIIS